MRKTSAKARMLNALLKGSQFSVPQARRRFGVKNVAARILELRNEDLHNNIVTIQGNSNRRNGHPIDIYTLLD